MTTTITKNCFPSEIDADTFREAPPSALINACRKSIARYMTEARDYGDTEVDIRKDIYIMDGHRCNAEISPRIFYILKTELEERGFIVSGDLVVLRSGAIGFTVSWKHPPPSPSTEKSPKRPRERGAC